MLGCLILIHGRFKDLVTFHQEVASARPLGERGNPIERRRRQEREKPVLIPCPLSRGARQRCAIAQGHCHHQRILLLVPLVEFQIRVEIHAHTEVNVLVIKKHLLLNL